MLVRLIIILLFVGVFQPAHAQIPTGGSDEPPSIAVIPLAAPSPAQAAQVNAACEAALRKMKGLKVITAAEWDKEAKESGQGDDLEAMARRLAADLLLTGTLAANPAGDGFRLSLDLFDGKANPVGAYTLELLVPVVGPAAAFRLEELLEQAVRPAVGLRPPPSPFAVPDTGDEPSPQDESDREKPKEVTDAVGTQKPAAPPPPRVRKPWAPIVEGHAGLMVVGRMLTCGNENAKRTNQPCNEAQFPLDAGAGVRLRAAIFPFAIPRDLHPALVGLGAEILLEAPFWRPREQKSGDSFSISELRFEGGLRWRYNLGNAVGRPILEAGVAYGIHRFHLTSQLQGRGVVPFPNATYQYVLPSVGAGAYLLPRFYLHGNASFLGVFDAGDVHAAVDEKNQNPFGPGSTLGVRGLLEGEYLVYKNLSIAVGGYVEYLASSFDGVGCTKLFTTQSVCDRNIVRTTPAPEAVLSASDLYLGGWVNLGYRY